MWTLPQTPAAAAIQPALHIAWLPAGRGAGTAGSGRVDTCPHAPVGPSRHSVTLLSPQDTANRLPATEKETRHTGAGKVGSGSPVQPPRAVSWRQMMTVPSSDAEAMMLRARPLVGHHATSRTHPLCPDSACSVDHPPVEAAAPPAAALTSRFHTRTLLSHPPVANRCTKCTPPAALGLPRAAAAGAVASPASSATPPMWYGGAQATALVPDAQSGKEAAAHVSSSDRKAQEVGGGRGERNDGVLLLAHRVGSRKIGEMQS